MTDITCPATSCRYNSSEFFNDDPGTCMLEHINLKDSHTFDDKDEADLMNCNEYDMDNNKPFVKKADKVI